MLKNLIKRIKKLLGLDEEIFHPPNKNEDIFPIKENIKIKSGFYTGHINKEPWNAEKSHENWMNIYGDEVREDYDVFRD